MTRSLGTTFDSARVHAEETSARVGIPQASDLAAQDAAHLRVLRNAVARLGLSEMLEMDDLQYRAAYGP